MSHVPRESRGMDRSERAAGWGPAEDSGRTRGYSGKRPFGALALCRCAGHAHDKCGRRRTPPSGMSLSCRRFMVLFSYFSVRTCPLSSVAFDQSALWPGTMNGRKMRLRKGCGIRALKGRSQCQSRLRCTVCDSRGLCYHCCATTLHIPGSYFS